MSINAMGLGFMFTATDMASNVMDRIKQNFVGLEEVAGKRLNGLDEMVRKLGGGLTMAAVGAGGLAASFGLAGKAGEFESALKDIHSVALDMSQNDLKQLADAAHKYGKELAISPKEVLAAMKLLAQTGYSTAETMEMIPNVLKFSSAAGMDAATAFDVLNQSLKGFEIPANHAVGAMDQMQQAANLFSMDVKDLHIAFGRLSAGVHNAGGTLGDALTVFGVVKDALGSVQLSATGTSLAFERLGNEKVLNSLKNIGVAVLDVDGNFRSVPDVLAELYEKWRVMGNEAVRKGFLEKAFGRDGVKAVETVFSKMNAGVVSKIDGQKKYGKAAIQDLRNFVESAVGTNDQANEIMQSKFEKSIKRMSVTFESLMENAGKPFMEIWRDVLFRINQGLDWLDEKVHAANPAVLKFGASVLTASAATLTFIGTAKFFNALSPLLGAGVDLVVESFTGFGRAIGQNARMLALWANPMNWKAIIGGLWQMAGAGAASALALWPFYVVAAAIGVAVYAVANNIGGLGDVWDNLTARFLAAGGVWESITKWFGGFWDAISSGFTTTMTYLSPVFEYIGKAITRLFDSFGELGKTLGFIGDSSGPGGMAIAWGKVFGGTIAWLGTMLVTGIAGLADFLSVLVDIGNWVFTKLKPIFKAIWGWLEPLVVRFEKWFETLVGIKGLFSGLGSAKPAAVVVDANGKAAPVQNTSTVQTNTAAATTVDNGGLSKPAATLAAIGGPEGWATTGRANGGTPRVDIDYEKMAAANRSIPIILNLDGRRVGELLRGATADDVARGRVPAERPVR